MSFTTLLLARWSFTMTHNVKHQKSFSVQSMQMVLNMYCFSSWQSCFLRYCSMLVSLLLLYSSLLSKVLRTRILCCIPANFFSFCDLLMTFFNVDIFRVIIWWSLIALSTSSRSSIWSCYQSKLPLFESVQMQKFYSLEFCKVTCARYLLIFTRMLRNSKEESMRG